MENNVLSPELNVCYVKPFLCQTALSIRQQVRKKVWFLRHTCTMLRASLNSLYHSRATITLSSHLNPFLCKVGVGNAVHYYIAEFLQLSLI